MTESAFIILVFVTSLAAGLFGALSGLGGGSIITPVLTLCFGVDLRYAIGASLISVIATSSGAAAAYVKEGFTNIRIGMFLELATTFGAIAGALLAQHISKSTLSVIFGLVMLQAAWMSFTKGESKEEPAPKPDLLAEKFQLRGSYPTPEGEKSYTAGNVPGGFGLMFVAGGLSGLLGIGSGAVKVIAMDNVMKLPLKVSTTTSNFMIGVTAAASAGIYLNRGYVDPIIAMPVMVGVLIGSLVGARILPKVSNKTLRVIFGSLVLLIAIEMIWNGLKGTP